MRVTGVYTTGEEGTNQDFYAQAEAIHGSAIAHNSGNSNSGQSAKFTNQEALLQDTKRELKAKAEKETERFEANQRAEAKSEVIAARREKQLMKKKADLEQLILFASTNRGLFPEFTTGPSRQHLSALLTEYQKPPKNKKFTATQQLVKDNMEAILALLTQQ
jgi:hypothetical protein